MEYDRAARKRLGRAVRAARINAGYTNRADFAEKMKRSTRQVQALENGEDGVGPDTWTAAAGALEQPVEWIYEILDGRRESDRSPSTALADVSDEELAAEVLRRMKVGEGDVGRDASSIGADGLVITAGPGTGKTEVFLQAVLARTLKQQLDGTPAEVDQPTIELAVNNAVDIAFSGLDADLYEDLAARLSTK